MEGSSMALCDGEGWEGRGQDGLCAREPGFWDILYRPGWSSEEINKYPWCMAALITHRSQKSGKRGIF